MYTLRVALQSFRTLERKNVVLSAGERLSVGTLALEVGGVGETVVVEARGTHVNTAETQHSGLITSTQIEQVQVLGRDVTSIMRLLPGVRYENTVDSLGMSFGTSVPNVGGARRDWSNVIVDGVVANEVGASSLMAQQINLDAIAEVRVLLNSYRAEYGPRRRRPGADRQQERHARTTTAISTTTAATRRSTPTTSSTTGANIKKPRYRFNTYGANLGGPVPEREQEAVLLLLDGGAARQPARAGAQLDDADRRRDAGRLLADARRPGPADQHQGSAARRAPATPSTGGPGVLPRQHHPRQPHQPERPRAAEHAAARPTTSTATFTQGQFNYTTQENAENPKMNNVVRVDWRPTANDSFYFTFKDWYSDQRGSEITAGPAKWGFFNTHYLNTDRGMQRELHEGPALEPGAATPTSAPVSRPSSSIR